MKVGGSADINHNPTKPTSVPADLFCAIPHWRRILYPWLFEVTLWWMNEKKCAIRTFICKVKTWSLYLKSFGQILVLVPRRLSGSRLKWDFQIKRHISLMLPIGFVCDHCISPLQDPCRHICSDLRERSRQRQIVRRERKEKEMSFWRSRLRRRWASWEVWKSSPLWSPTLPIPSSYKNVIIISDWTVFDSNPKVGSRLGRRWE